MNNERTNAKQKIRVDVVLKDSCCRTFEDAVNDQSIVPVLVPGGIQFIIRGNAIKHCPFCGKVVEAVNSHTLIRFAERAVAGAGR